MAYCNVFGRAGHVKKRALRLLCNSAQCLNVEEYDRRDRLVGLGADVPPRLPVLASSAHARGARARAGATGEEELRALGTALVGSAPEWRRTLNAAHGAG